MKYYTINVLKNPKEDPSANLQTAKRLLIIMALIGGQLIFGTPVFGVTDAIITVNLSITNQHLSLAQFGNLNIPSSSDVSFTIGTVVMHFLPESQLAPKQLQ